MPGPDIGVVIATRNRADRLAATLRRLSDLPEQPRLLVVDNASTDGTAAMVADRFPAVQLVTLSANRGALARNDGVCHLDTEYVAFSDDDSWWDPGALRTAARLLDAHPDLGLLAARTFVEPDGDPDPLNEELADSPLGADRDLPGPRVLGFLGCAAVVRRSAFRQAGGFHPVLFFGAEETLLAYDLTAHGWQVCYAPQVIARHHPDTAPRAERDALVRRNELLTAWLRRPLPVAFRRTAHLLGAAPRDREARAALYGVARRFPRAVVRRRRLPAEVERSVRRLEATREAVRPGAATARAVAAGAAGPTGATVVAGGAETDRPDAGPPAASAVPDAADINVASGGSGDTPPAADRDGPPDGGPTRNQRRAARRRRWRPGRRAGADPGLWCTTPARSRPGGPRDR